MSSESVCPCEEFEHPAHVSNFPGLRHVNYRVADFLSFRRALLMPLANEQALKEWKPGRHGDLLIQVLEWWAYIADVLTFYTERSLNESLLNTAELDESVRRIVRILGYRPRPGIAASTYVAALLNSPKPATLPPGFAVDSKPAPGKQPQTYETDSATVIALPDAVAAAVPGQLAGTDGRLCLEGTVNDIQPGELLILMPAGGPVSKGMPITVKETHQGRDPAGKLYTEIVLKEPPSLPNGPAIGYRLLRSRRSVGLWKYPTDAGKVVTAEWQIQIVGTTANLQGVVLHMEGVERGVQGGQPMVIHAPGEPTVQSRLFTVTDCSEQVWYANSKPATPEIPPNSDPNSIPIPILHSLLKFEASSFEFELNIWNSIKNKVRVLIDWQPAGTLRDAPISSYNGGSKQLLAAAGQRFRVGPNQTVFIEDADGNGVMATANVSETAPERMEIVSFATTPPELKTPLKVLQNVFKITHGKTVKSEILGSGNATVAGQEFVLKKSPLTYLPWSDSYKSMLKVYVNGIQWTEVQSFYGQPPDAQVFVTREDDQNKTHVVFGDGVNGVRLPTGRDNIVASYRFGSGAEAPGAGSLTVIAKAYPGLRALRHPVDAGGGADPDPRDQIRRYAPKSVLTFGRAISGDDYETIAAQAPGVSRAQAVYGWNPNEQRATVTIYVGDDAAAVESARNSLRIAADPNRPVSVLAAKPVNVGLGISVRILPDRNPEDVLGKVRESISDPERGLMGMKRVRIGQRFYLSQISHACLNVPGVQSVAGSFALIIKPLPPFLFALPPVPFLIVAIAIGCIQLCSSIMPSPGEFVHLPAEWVFIFPEVLTSV